MKNSKKALLIALMMCCGSACSIKTRPGLYPIETVETAPVGVYTVDLIAPDGKKLVRCLDEDSYRNLGVNYQKYKDALQACQDFLRDANKRPICGK